MSRRKLRVQLLRLAARQQEIESLTVQLGGARRSSNVGIPLDGVEPAVPAVGRRRRRGTPPERGRVQDAGEAQGERGQMHID